RLSWFFLATLALVLAGFSVALYFLASHHLQAQAEERLDATLNKIVAAMENGPDGPEWGPARRQLNFGFSQTGEIVGWSISDEQGRVISGSGRPGPQEMLVNAMEVVRSDQVQAMQEMWQGRPWLFGMRRIQRASTEAVAIPTELLPGKHAVLTISAG